MSRGTGALEEQVVAYCAPTLAGLKSASLFSYFYTDARRADEELAEINAALNEKGVFADILLRRGDSLLLYVYRKERLWRELLEPEARALLAEYGYRDCRVESCLRRLKERLRRSECFPHEIGVFLGYPPEDVRGFIQNGGRNCVCCGAWKVYCHPAEKKALFDRMKRCTLTYRERFAKGRNLAQMTVAG